MRDPFSSRRATVRLARIAMGGAVMCLLAPFSIPLPGGVPISLGSFAAVFLGLFLGPWEGTASVFLYLALGAAGLPVFSGGAGGVGKLFGVTGGYLIGFLFLSLLSGLFRDKRWRVSGVLAGEVVLYLFGTLWFYLQSPGKTFGALLMACCVPFLPGDAVKCALALYLYRLFRRRGIRKSGAAESPEETGEEKREE